MNLDDSCFHKSKINCNTIQRINFQLIQKNFLVILKNIHLFIKIYSAPGTNPENEVNYFVETNKYAQTGKEKYHKLKEIRENLEKFGGIFDIYFESCNCILS